MNAETGKSMSRYPLTKVFLAVLASNVLMVTAAHAAASLGELVAQLESAVPFTSIKIERALSIGMQKSESNGAVTYRGAAMKLEDGSTIEGLVWTPKAGKKPSEAILTLPAVAARATGCVSRADVSREFGAPTRNWTSKTGEISYSHFEFARPKNKVNVAFSDVTNCLATLSIEELR
jgi:hypothetical protein